MVTYETVKKILTKSQIEEKDRCSILKLIDHYREKISQFSIMDMAIHDMEEEDDDGEL